jgi:hypothetical protein
VGSPANSTTAASATAATFSAAVPADTTRTASAEGTQFLFDGSATQTWSAGAITSHRQGLFKAPTLAFASSSTVTDAATLAIDAAPIAGSNATLTRTYAFWVQAGKARFDGGLELTQAGPTISAGSGTPEGAITAPVGSVYLRTNGGASTSLYVKESGAGNTGWVAK